MFTRQEMIDSFSDFHKDAYGFRPRWDYGSLSLEELKSHFDSFEDACRQNAIDADLREKAGIKAFKTLLEKIMKMCSCDEKKAVKYLMDAEDDPYIQGGDLDYFNYIYDLPYGYVQGVA